MTGNQLSANISPGCQVPFRDNYEHEMIMQ